MGCGASEPPRLPRLLDELLGLLAHAGPHGVVERVVGVPDLLKQHRLVLAWEKRGVGGMYFAAM